ncbi:hypothetical protein AGMMS49928_18470 [Spirochaetia bacterium]|nr:hypothetical protein AGMMS49928_18470 [Spirochaetia bacterium]
MKTVKNMVNLGLAALVLFAVTACDNFLNMPEKNDAGKNGLVRIYLGEKSAKARTLQPGQDALAGYRLTFAGGVGSQEPVDIAGTNYADVYLDDGSWTITAKAYKKDGVIGQESDKVAEGSAAITISNGKAEGAPLSIILKSAGEGNGTLRYNISFSSGVTGGELKLWDIEDAAVSGFGDNGVLTLTASVNSSYTLAAGRYIVEARLTNSAGNVAAFRREVVEIWADTESAFVLSSGQNLSSQQITEGVYIGIVSLAGTAVDLTGGRPILLNASGYSNLTSILQNQYKISSNTGTALFYGVHRALANLKTNETRYPANLHSVNLITFTDGLDNASEGQGNAAPIEGYAPEDTPAYAAYVQGELASRFIAAKQVNAYSVGVRGSDVTDISVFQNNLQSIASDTGKVQVLANFDNLQTTFAEIADGLNIVVQTGTAITIKTSLLGNNTKVRMTFDYVTNGAASQRYIEGTISRTGTGADQKYAFTNITYRGGLGSAAGSGPIAGTINGTEISFRFERMENYDPDLDNAYVQQWTQSPGSTIWSIDSEQSGSGQAESMVEERSSIIYLVLDNSTSLDATNVNQIRNAAIEFLDSLYRTYTVSYSAGGGTGTLPPESRKKKRIEIKLPVPSKLIAPAGKTFDCWVNGANTYQPGDSYTVTSNVTFTAQWKDGYTASIAANIPGGTVSADKTYGLWGTIVALSNTPATGYDFNYYTVAGIPMAGNILALTANVTVSAVFSPQGAERFNVTRWTNITGGTVYVSTTGGIAGTPVTLSNIPAWGYALDHYTVNGDQIEGNTFTLDGDVTVSAVFNRIAGEGKITIVDPSLPQEETVGGIPASIDISRSGPSDTTHTIQITGSYTRYEWYIDSRQKNPDSGSGGTALTLNAADYGVGNHTLTVVVYKGTVPYSAERLFTVSE